MLSADSMACAIQADGSSCPLSIGINSVHEMPSKVESATSLIPLLSMALSIFIATLRAFRRVSWFARRASAFSLQRDGVGEANCLSLKVIYMYAELFSVLYVCYCQYHNTLERSLILSYARWAAEMSFFGALPLSTSSHIVQVTLSASLHFLINPMSQKKHKDKVKYAIWQILEQIIAHLCAKHADIVLYGGEKLTLS